MTLIDGVKTRVLRRVPDERGFLAELLRSDWEEFERFGQAYITAAYPGVVKGWHYHKKQTDHFAGILGMSKVVLFDPRDHSPTKGLINEFFIGEQNLMLVKIPPLVIHGYKSVGDRISVIVNFPTELFNYQEPDEFRIPYDSPDIPYDWAVKLG
jgi:dTDP-4-dehydrorhamnose 3,5-epimerase